MLGPRPPGLGSVCGIIVISQPQPRFQLLMQHWKIGSFGLLRRGMGGFKNLCIFSLSTIHLSSRLLLGMTCYFRAMPTVIIFNIHFGSIQTPKSKIYHISRSISGSSSRLSRMCSPNKVCPQRKNVQGLKQVAWHMLAVPRQTRNTRSQIMSCSVSQCGWTIFVPS